MKNRMDADERLKIIGLGGCWFAEYTKTSYDTYEELRRHEVGPYRYACGKEVSIEDPKKYDFFNPDTGKGYLVGGGCWYSPSSNSSYDSLEHCSRLNDDCKCICTDDYAKAFKIDSETPNRKSRVAMERKRDEKGHFI